MPLSESRFQGAPNIAALLAGVGGRLASLTDRQYALNNALLNVCDLGADSSGVVDSSAAFAAALATPGAVVVIPAGLYQCAANLPEPLCSMIVGQGDGVSVIQCGNAVTKLIPMGTACDVLRDFTIIGNSTAGAIGLVFGDVNAGAYYVENVRVKLFTGAGAVGAKFKSCLKSRFVRMTLERNATNKIVDGTGGVPGDPTTLTFDSLVCIDAGLGGGGSGVGVKIITADTIVYNEPIFDSNSAEAVLVQPGVGGTVVELIFNNPRFEANNDGAGNYQVTVDGTAAGCTARIRVHGGAWSAAGKTSKSLHLNGAGVAAYFIQQPQVLDAAGTVLIENGAYGVLSLPANLAPDRVTDATGFGARYGRGQVQFPATQNASTDAHTLDDYAEGTFAPTLALGAGSVTYTTQTGSFTKVGRKVTVQGRIVVNTVTTPGGTLEIGGLPYASSATQKGAVSVFGSGLAASATSLMCGEVEPGANLIRLYRSNGAGGLVDPGADIAAGAVVRFTATYEV